MKVNPTKFQAIIFKPNLEATSSIDFCLSDGTVIKPTDNVKLLGMTLDEKLDYNMHINSLFKKCTRQLNVIGRLSKYLNMECKERIFDAFTISNLNYCSVIYHFCSVSDTKRLERIQKRFLRYLLNDFNSSYSELLTASCRNTLYTSRQRIILEHVFKIRHDLLPPMDSSFFVCNVSNDYNLRRNELLALPDYNYKKFGYHSLKYQGAKLWNAIPNDHRQISDLKEFKCVIAQWNNECECNSCLACSLQMI